MSLPSDLSDLDRNGLVTLAERWTPAGLVMEEHGRRMLNAWRDQIAHALNMLIDFETYVPILLNPHRCADGDIYRVLEFQGIDARRGSSSYAKLRRLAILGADLRAWRGAFRSHRTVASALTAGPAIVRTWVADRWVMDVSTWAFTYLTEDESDETTIFVFGQGPGATEYNAGELDDRINELAKPALDVITVVPCFALTAWRNGINSWAPIAVVGEYSLVLPEYDRKYYEIQGEYEALDIGPDISASAVQFIETPTVSDSIANGEGVWGTCWFKTSGATDGDTWEFWLVGDRDDLDAYVAKVSVGNHTVELFRVVANVYTSLGSHAFNIEDGLTGGYHRLDMVVVLQAGSPCARVKAYVNHDPTAWFDDAGLAVSRPAGLRGYAGLKTTDFTTGRLRIAAVTFKHQT